MPHPNTNKHRRGQTKTKYLHPRILAKIREFVRARAEARESLAGSVS